jgi:hypothetical protein
MYLIENETANEKNFYCIYKSIVIIRMDSTELGNYKGVMLCNRPFVGNSG